MENEKAMLKIDNGYCCGHGQIMYKIEDWCLKHDIPYEIKPVRGPSMAYYKDKSLEVKSNLQLWEILDTLGLI